jgi:cell division transport system permease protein
MSTNRTIIEVLHVIGARKDFIAGEFQRHFLMLGLKGGAIGGVVAIVLFALIGWMSDWFKGGAEDNLFGSLSLGPAGYGAIIGLVVLVAGVTAGTSRLTVHRTLKAME